MKKQPAKRQNETRSLGNVLKSIASVQSAVDFAQIAGEIIDESAFDADCIGYLNRELVQTSLPHTNPAPAEVWTRWNGNLSLTIQPRKYMTRTGKLRSHGFPYGLYPRLVLVQVCTDALLSPDGPRIELERSLRGYMKNVGIDGITGGRYGSITNFKDQWRRLFTAGFLFRYEMEDESAAYEEPLPLTKNIAVFWDHSNPDQQGLFDSYVELAPDFYQRIIDHPVPIDLRAVLALKKHLLAVDLYIWLNHRVTWARKKAFIPWKALHAQAGSNYTGADGVKNFKRKAKTELKRVKGIWPDLKIEEARGGFLLHPQRSHVGPKEIIIG